jgi:hypothetical protein
MFDLGELRRQPIARVVGVVVRARAINHLRDVAHSVELILEVSNGVAALRMR